MKQDSTGLPKLDPAVLLSDRTTCVSSPTGYSIPIFLE